MGQGKGAEAGKLEGSIWVERHPGNGLLSDPIMLWPVAITMPPQPDPAQCFAVFISIIRRQMCAVAIPTALNSFAMLMKQRGGTARMLRKPTLLFVLE